MCLTDIYAWIPFLFGQGERKWGVGSECELLGTGQAEPALRITNIFRCCCCSSETECVYVTKSEKIPLQRRQIPQPSGSVECSLEEKVSALFERYKQEKNWLWVKEALLMLPKGELHNHLVPDPDDNLAYAAEMNLIYNTKNNKFETPTAVTENSLPAYFNVETHPSMVTAKEMLLCPRGMEYQNYFNCVTLGAQGSHPNHFFDSFDTILSTDMPLDRQICGEIKKLIADHIPYAELTIDFQLGTRPLLQDFSLANMEEHYKVIRPWCERYATKWMAKLDGHIDSITKRLNWEHPWNSEKNPITVGFLAEIMRTASGASVEPNEALATFFIDVAATMTLCQKDPERIFGISVVGPEHNPFAKAQRVSQAEVLDFLYHKLGKPNITLHAGEITSQLSLVSDMKDPLSLAIYKGHAKRIGHGLCLEKTQNAYALMKAMRDKGVLIETCLTSNQKIFGIDLQQHPIKTYQQEKVKIALGTDDPHILNTTLTEEFLKAVQNYDYSYAQIKELIRNSIEHSFLPGESLFDHAGGKLVVKTHFQQIFQKKEADWTAADKEMWNSSWKARMQILVEKNLAEREKEILEIRQGSSCCFAG